VDFVLVVLVVMAVGSIVSLIVVPPFLYKIERTGRVNFFGIKFL
jgi:predicted RND superfamily exporter protein